MAWYQRKVFWRRLLIYAVVLVIGAVVVRWRWQVKQARQAEQIRTEERQLVKALVAHYRGVYKVHFAGVTYNPMTGSTLYSFLVNEQKDYTVYTVEEGPGQYGAPDIRYSESFFDKNDENGRYLQFRPR
ncbi:MAG: hypothetical protein LKJ69_06850 [Lactobacillus sp.]|jgi:hypothetical protein|nr:hypothetical protein [Lactobacillus sp.]